MATPRNTTPRPSGHPGARRVNGQPAALARAPQAAAPKTAAPKSAPPQPTGALRVRATHMGYYGDIRRRPGDVFTIDASHFSAKWMEQVDGQTAERVTSGKQALRKQHDEILNGSVKSGIQTDIDNPGTGGDNPLGE